LKKKKKITQEHK